MSTATTSDRAGFAPGAIFKYIGWTVLIAAALFFYVTRAVPFFTFNEEVFGPYFWAKRASLMPHILGGTLALFMGPFQFWTGLRRKNMTLHRWTGRLYVAGVAIGTLAAMGLVATAYNWAWGASLAGLAIAWFVTTGMALIAIRRRKVEQHKQWMIRSYVVTFAFITFRILEALPHPAGVTVPEFESTMLWICWTIPLLVTEVVLQSRSLARA